MAYLPYPPGGKTPGLTHVTSPVVVPYPCRVRPVPLPTASGLQRHFQAARMIVVVHSPFLLHVPPGKERQPLPIRRRVADLAIYDREIRVLQFCS